MIVIQPVHIAHVADSITRINVRNGVLHTDYDTAAEYAAELLWAWNWVLGYAQMYAEGRLTPEELDAQIQRAIDESAD